MPSRSIALLILALVVARPAAAQEPPPPCGDKATPSPCTCQLTRLRPTQRSIGWLHLQDILSASPDKLQTRALSRPAQVILGPDGALYVVDGHHHARAAFEQWRAFIGKPTTTCQIVGDDSAAPDTTREAFLARLAARGQARLNGGDDVDGAVQPGVFPPASLGDMTNDSFRTLADFVEDGCKFKATGDFGQFPLADVLRHAGVARPVSLDDSKQQGRQAARDLMARLDSSNQRAAFDALPDHGAIAKCPAP